MKLGLPRKITPSIADNVTIPTHNAGNNSPIAPLIMSAMILTTIVQLPSYCTGIINKIIPMIDGTKNPASEPCFLFSISIPFVKILERNSRNKSRIIITLIERVSINFFVKKKQPSFYKPSRLFIWKIFLESFVA